MRPTITTRPDLTRTRAAIAAYDEIDAQIERCPTCDFEALLDGLDEAKRAIGAAFALDTADRNDPEVLLITTTAEGTDMAKRVANVEAAVNEVIDAIFSA